MVDITYHKLDSDLEYFTEMIHFVVLTALSDYYLLL